MSAQLPTCMGENEPPSLPCADPLRLLEEPRTLLLTGETSELRPAWMALCHELLLAVKDGGVDVVTIVPEALLPHLEIDDKGTGERRVRVAVEVEVFEVGDPGFPMMELDDIGEVNLADQRLGAAFVDAEHRR